jgi:hypothetical protein
MILMLSVTGGLTSTTSHSALKTVHSTRSTRLKSTFWHAAPGPVGMGNCLTIMSSLKHWSNTFSTSRQSFSVVGGHSLIPVYSLTGQSPGCKNSPVTGSIAGPAIFQALLSYNFPKLILKAAASLLLIYTMNAEKICYCCYLEKGSFIFMGRNTYNLKINLLSGLPIQYKEKS